ncbi:Rho GTPase-activating protein 27 [Leucoagaricus sp. SymC.cos]|nr:Rho GTPase-activating protein 27 [Leucoagaricus sp. SymC.cos]
MDQQTPISARASASDLSIATQGPIPIFDIHLRFLADSYIGFFQERKRIEEAYIDSLKKLHRKAKSTDAYLEEKGELSTTRGAWSEVRDNLEREAQARQAFCATLTTDILNPLTNLKETQERTRKRIKEDLKDSTSAYTEYAEVVLPKLKARYAKKFVEVEEQKKASSGPPIPLQPTQSVPEQHNNSFKNNGLGAGRPTVTAPQPLRALDRRPSGSGIPARNRSPSSSTAFSDLAHQGKRQLNQLMGLLDKGGTGAGGLSSSREHQALRAVRAKRDADDAEDKEYRKGVHWLETLRLRRTKILESGYMSLEMFVSESAAFLKKTLEKYTDNMIATNTTLTQLSKHARGIVDKISSEKDTVRLVANTRRSLASAIPDPILYEHGQVGPCNDLIFGFGLGDYATAKGLREGEIPKIVRICIAEIDNRGLESEGIYRVSSRRHAIVQAMQHEIERDEAAFEFSPKDDVYAVSSLLKLYLRELPEPLFKFSLQDRVQHSENLAEHQNQNFILLRSKMRRLPSVHQATLKALIEHLSRIVSHSEKNKMDAKNLAIVFGGMIFGEDELPKGGDLLSVQATKDSLFEDLIINAHVLFDEHQTQYPPLSPPLPPTPAGEAALDISYGSKSTKVASVPPKSLSPPPPCSPQDFTPALPPRPNTSIHPSSRIMPTSPTRPRADIPSPTTISSQRSVSAPSSPSTSTECETDDSLSYHEPVPPSSSETRGEPSSSTSATSPTPLSPPSLRKTELPPTPKETPASSPLEPHAGKDS